MNRTALILALAAAAVVSSSCGARSAPASTTPITSGIKDLQMSPQELRIRVRALIRPVLGTIEERGDRMLAETKEPLLRRYLLIWKFEATSTMLAALLRPDPVLAVADAWGYVKQMEVYLQTPRMQAAFGPSVPEAQAALDELQSIFREFASSVQENLSGDVLEAEIADWALENPIKGALYRRPSMDSAVAADLAQAHRGGAFAALGSLEETTADLMKRMDLYTVYLPRLARWEAELVIDDVMGDVDLGGAMAEVERFTDATQHLADVAESATSSISEEREIVLDAVRLEREVVLRAIQQERIETLREIEAIAERLMDRSRGPVQEATREELTHLVDQIEDMRMRLMDDAGVTLDKVVDHVFYRALQLLLVAALLAAIGLFVHARFLRR